MPSNRSRIYQFRTPDFRGNNPFRKLFFILGIIVFLYVLDLMLYGTKTMVLTLIDRIIFLPVILISLTVHEFSHAWMADFLGDPTARNLGRLSLDPRRHLDLWGTLLLFFANFGWAKPVPVDPSNFRVPDRAMMSVSLAGPISNVFMAILGGGILKILLLSYPEIPAGYLLKTSMVGMFANYLISINLGLACFNMIPLPPLDGSKVLAYFLSPKQRFQYSSFETTGPFILILLVSLGLVRIVVDPFMNLGWNLIVKLYQM